MTTGDDTVGRRLVFIYERASDVSSHCGGDGARPSNEAGLRDSVNRLIPRDSYFLRQHFRLDVARILPHVLHIG